jgi:hypothetical protein
MTKQDLDKRLKNDAEANRFTIDGDYIVFDNNSNLDYQILESFKLKELKTKNPISKTRLNKNLLVVVDTIRENFGRPLVVRATYQSPEYHLTTFGSMDSTLYTTGDAISLGVDAKYLDGLVAACNENWTRGEFGVYKWGVHIGYTTERKEWDKRNDTSVKQKVMDVISNDSMKNMILIAAALFGGWFFFLRKK